MTGKWLRELGTSPNAVVSTSVLAGTTTIGFEVSAGAGRSASMFINLPDALADDLATAIQASRKKKRGKR